jgi:hypothetical protein
MGEGGAVDRLAAEHPRHFRKMVAAPSDTASHGAGEAERQIEKIGTTALADR